jgi:GNAT superfamily N-acetyltransferase
MNLPPAAAIEIRPAQLPQDLAVVRTLFREYADGTGIDLCFQNFDAEMAELPGKYAAPAGRILLAWQGAEPVACVALRPIDDAAGDCEMKRFYVRPQARGQNIGRQLAERICDEARAAGYARICLDTVPAMAPAIALYKSMGFVPTAPYVFNPLEGVLFLALKLQ